MEYMAPAELEAVVDEAVRRIVDEVHPERIILFGSAARGRLGPDSDLDLIVVKAGVKRRATAIRLYKRLRGLGVPKDILVFTPDDIERYRDSVGHILCTALEEGRVVFDA